MVDATLNAAADPVMDTMTGATKEAEYSVTQLRTMMGEEFRALTTTALVDRYKFFRGAGVTFGGDRDLYLIFGYNDFLTPLDYRSRYERGGIAGRVVDALPKATWRGQGTLVEDEDPKIDTKFEKDWQSLDKRLKIWPTFERADILSRVTSFAVIMIGVKGAGGTETPLPKGTGPDDVIFLSDPYMGGAGPSVSRGVRVRPAREAIVADATITDWDTDVTSPRFGRPLYYQLSRVNAAIPLPALRVHWSRIIHFADGAIEDGIFGEPALRRPWNYFDDLEKVCGGGAEAFFLRANKGTQFDIDKGVKNLSTEEKKDFKEQIDAYVHGMTRVLRTRGVNVTDLGSNVADFSNPIDAIVTLIAGTSTIPKRILTGAEAGELASSQDRENWRDQVIGRQTGYAEPFLLRQLADRLIENGYLTEPKDYKAEWQHTQVMTEDERSAGALSWAQVNAAQGSIVFTDDEIRDHWYGMDPLPPAVKQAIADAKAAVDATKAAALNPAAVNPAKDAVPPAKDVKTP